MRILTAWDRNSKRAVVAKVDLRLVATPNPAYDSPWGVENFTGETPVLPIRVFTGARGSTT